MNPALNDKTFSGVGYSEEKMTVSGVINKSIILWMILAVGAYLGWKNPAVTAPLLLPICLISFVLALFIIFKKTTCPFLSPFYAFGEGLLMGTLTLFFEKQYPGIAFNAVFLTISVLFCMLAAFRAGIIKPTNKFYFIVGISTLAICLLYIVEIVLSLFGVAGFTFINDSGPWGILFSVFVVIIASLNLIIDFDMIQKGVAFGAPEYMEWYGAFALMVTIVWLYMEILRLLGKVRR
ncbi:MAG: Bax inhibitor-1/YccA family protein [Endomicrobiaceae bacterium]|nr:Bax inhibitor-1/YccA family protein [Endomicrobiaceae bacterium]